MRKNLLSTHMLLTTLVVSIFVFCAHRETDPDARTNPYDPGSSSWKENASPVINVSSDTLWYDYNHSKGTGTIKISVKEDDLNFPYDTLTGSVFFNSTEIKLQRSLSKKDTTLLLSGIKLDTIAQCTVTVYDSKQCVSSKVLNITVPDSSPALPPQTRINNSSQEVALTWTQAPNAHYVVYYSDSLKGPYSDSIIVNQTSNSSVSVYNQPSGYLPRYYIVATVNKFGTARSTDTLIGRRYYSGISTPSINSVSQGTYANCIVLSIYNYAYNIDYIEIYRSTNDTSAFRFIDKMNLNSSYSSLYYYDSVKTSSSYFYRICAIDQQGRCSYPSAAQYGYLQRLYAPSLYANPYPDFIQLSWSTISGAAKYRLYRSPLNCIDSVKLLTETNLVACSDTPPNSKIYYYTVSAIASNGLEGSKSSCVPGKISVLPQPDSVVVTTNYFPRHVALAWRKTIGAVGYIIYRSNYNSYSDTIPIDTISSNSYNDTLPDNSLHYYRIAAYNNKGTGLVSVMYSGSAITPIFSNYSSKNDSVFLTFSSHNRAIKYLIYRSSNQTDFTLIDSTTKTSFSAPLKDFTTCYYRFAIQTPEGVSYPSATASIIRQLSTPSNIQVIELSNGVKIQWNKVMGAEQYDICRSVYNNSAGSIYRTITDSFFIDTIPEGSPLYYYFVRSKNSVSYSPISVGYPGSRLRPPSTPSSISVTGQLKAIILSWGIPATSANPTGFTIYRSIDNVTFKKIDSTKNYTYSDSVPDTVRYYYRISAYNAQGESSMSSSYYAALTRPAAPQNLTGTLATSKKYIRITWTPVSSFTKYAVYRSPSADGTYEYLGSVTNTNIFYDSSCNENTTYYYKAASVTTGNQSSLSAYTIGIRLGRPVIISVGMTNEGTNITWYKPSYTFQYFYVYKSSTDAGPYIKIDSTTKDSYVDITGKETNYYKISTFNTVESDLSVGVTTNSIMSTQEPQSVSATQGTQTDMITITWLAAKDAFAYKIYRAPTDSFNRNIVLVAQVSGTSFSDTVHSDSIYYYKVTTVKLSGEGGFAVEPTFGYRYPYTKPIAPTYLYISPGTSGIVVGWYPSPTSIGYNKYNLYRSTSSDGVFELVGTKSVLTTLTLRYITDIPPQKAPTIYWYYVTSVNQRGESAPSQKVSGAQPQ